MEKRIHRVTRSLFAKAWEAAVNDSASRVFLAATVQGKDIDMELPKNLDFDAVYDIAERFWDGVDRYKAIC